MSKRRLAETLSLPVSSAVAALSTGTIPLCVATDTFLPSAENAPLAMVPESSGESARWPSLPLGVGVSVGDFGEGILTVSAGLESISKRQMQILPPRSAVAKSPAAGAAATNSDAVLPGESAVILPSARFTSHRRASCSQ